jgi:type VI protein secretion system component Hcp
MEGVMKNALLVTGVLVGAVLAALLAWAVFGGSGGARKAALQEPTQSGSIGTLTVSGISGGSQMPVSSFDWQGGIVDHDVRVEELEVLRVPDAASPGLFSSLTARTQIATSQLDLSMPGATTPYLRFPMANVRLTDAKPGKLEKVGLLSFSNAGFDVVATRGPEPPVDSAQVIGQMTLPGERGTLPIYFVGGGPILSNNSVGGRPIEIRRPLDHTAAALWTALKDRTDLGLVQIELQTPDERAPHVIYKLRTGVSVETLQTYGAAGRTPTETFELTYRTLYVISGGNSSCYDFVVNQAC